MSVVKETTICLLTLIGLPGCGKTSLSSFLCECLNNSTVPIPYNSIVNVCYDEILDLHDILQWSKARKLLLTSVNEMVEKLIEHNDLKLVEKLFKFNTVCDDSFFVTPKILIVIDDNMYYKSMRYSYYQIARHYNLSYCQIHLQCIISECIRRNSERNAANIVSEQTILKMARNLEIPNASTYEWENYSISVDSTKSFNSSLALICKVIGDAFANPVYSPPNTLKEYSQTITSISFIHQVDIFLRKIISGIIKKEKSTLGKTQLKELSSCLNSKKQTLLQEIKAGQYDISDEIINGIEDADPKAISALQALLQEHLN